MLFAQEMPPPPPGPPRFEWIAIALSSVVAIFALAALWAVLSGRWPRGGSRGTSDSPRDLAEELRHLRWRIDGLERDIDELRRRLPPPPASSAPPGPDDRVRPAS